MNEIITLDEEAKREDPLKDIRKLFGQDPNREIDLESGNYSIPGTAYSPNPATRLRGNPGNNDIRAKIKEWLTKASIPNWACVAMGAVFLTIIIVTGKKGGE